MFDKRGTGLSDRFSELPTLEVRMDDLRAVLDDIGSERTALLGSMEGNHLAALFAATYPERTSALVLYDPVARFVVGSGLSLGRRRERSGSGLSNASQRTGDRGRSSTTCCAPPIRGWARKRVSAVGTRPTSDSQQVRDQPPPSTG